MDDAKTPARPQYKRDKTGRLKILKRRKNTGTPKQDGYTLNALKWRFYGQACDAMICTVACFLGNSGKYVKFFNDVVHLLAAFKKLVSGEPKVERILVAVGTDFNRYNRGAGRELFRIWRRWRNQPAKEVRATSDASTCSVGRAATEHTPLLARKPGSACQISRPYSGGSPLRVASLIRSAPLIPQRSQGAHVRPMPRS